MLEAKVRGLSAAGVVFRAAPPVHRNNGVAARRFRNQAQ